MDPQILSSSYKLTLDVKQGMRSFSRGVDVRPGAVRHARLQAGLSLAQVGGTERSRTAIHLIEVGRSRPTPETLRLIAERTGKPVEYFLRDDAAHPSGSGPTYQERLERLLRAGQCEQLLQATDDTPTGVAPADEAWVSLYRGEAMIRLGRPDDALVEIRSARSSFEELGDRWMVVACLEREATALARRDDPSALGVATEALERCRALRPPVQALEARILARLTSLHISGGEWTKALELSERTIEAASPLYDLRHMADTYDDLGAAYGETGDPARATLYSRKAGVLRDLLRDQLALVRAENDMGLALMRLGDVAAAQEHMERSLGLCRKIGLGDGQSHILLRLAELHLEKGEYEQAAQRAEEVKHLSRTMGEPAAVALAHQMVGKVAARAGDHERADHEFRSAIELLQSLGQLQRVSDCHATYGQILEERGETALALQHLKLALLTSRGELGAAPPDGEAGPARPTAPLGAPEG